MTKIPASALHAAVDPQPANAPPIGEPTVVSTRMTFAMPAARAWEGLMFYEQIDERPPLYLRMLLPVPIRTEGRKSQVGDEARCIYESGYLIKRVTRVDPAQHYGFEVSEQALAVGGTRLFGGSYSLREISNGRTEITLVTRYQSPRRPRWFWDPLEAMVAHAFHRHILSAMKRNLQPR